MNYTNTCRSPFNLEVSLCFVVHISLRVHVGRHSWPFLPTRSMTSRTLKAPSHRFKLHYNSDLSNRSRSVVGNDRVQKWKEHTSLLSTFFPFVVTSHVSNGRKQTHLTASSLNTMRAPKSLIEMAPIIRKHDDGQARRCWIPGLLSGSPSGNQMWLPTAEVRKTTRRH